jgi:MYXO-CTERM domain-containing protein
VVGLAPLAAGSTVTATATAPGKGTSAPSAAPVVARSETPTVAGPLGEGATEVRGSSTEAAGTTITVIVDGVAAGTATVQPDGTWVATVPPLAVGSGVTAVATAPGKGPSLPTAVVTVIAKTQPPVVTGPLADGDTLVRGVSLEPNAAITVYVNGTSRGAGTAAGTGWTVTVPALVAGEVVTARAQAAGRPLSDPSNAVTVLGRTAKPTVTAPLVEGDTSLAGVTPNGGVVEIFVNGSPVGNATVSGITFSLQVAALTAGQVVTARATAAPLATSPLSDPVSVLRRSAAPVLDTPLGEGDTRVSGSSSEPDGTVVIIYVNGVPVGSATVSGGRWSGVVPPLSEGSSVTTTAQAPGTAPSRPSTAVVVLRRSESPTVDSPIPVGGTEVSGTSNEPPGTEIDVYVDGELVGTTTVGENGSWSVDVPPLGDGQEVTAVAAASGTAPSHPSSPVVVGVGMGSDGGANPPPSFIDARGGAFSCSTTAGGPAWSILLLVALAAAAVRRRRPSRAPAGREARQGRPGTR